MFITNKVCKSTRCLVLKKIEQQFMEDLKVLNNYLLDSMAKNPSSNVVVVAQR